MKEFLLIGITLCLSYEQAWSAFEIENLCPEATALQGTYSALGRDPWAMVFNPAQTVRLSDTQISMVYSRLHPGFGTLRAQSLNAAWTRTLFFTGIGLGFVLVDTNLQYREITGILNLARRFGEEKEVWDFSWGTNLKALSLRRGDPAQPNDPALAPVTFNRFTADAGCHLRIRRGYMGLSVQNMIPASIGLVRSETVPTETRFGVGVEKIPISGKRGFTVSPAAEWVRRGGTLSLRGGVTLHFLDLLSFHGGANSESFSLGLTLNLDTRREQKRNEKYSKDVRKFVPFKLSAGAQYPLQGKERMASPLLGITFVF
ncbi:MAG: hypothetical protein HYY63_02315 [Elusimicrobia bacterium]|nr:hypothetical protein [Elusimicrobiota bacterium]